MQRGDTSRLPASTRSDTKPQKVQHRSYSTQTTACPSMLIAGREHAGAHDAAVYRISIELVLSPVLIIQSILAYKRNP